MRGMVFVYYSICLMKLFEDVVNLHEAVTLRLWNAF